MRKKVNDQTRLNLMFDLATPSLWQRAIYIICVYAENCCTHSFRFNAMIKCKAETILKPPNKTISFKWIEPEACMYTVQYKTGKCAAME